LSHISASVRPQCSTTYPHFCHVHTETGVMKVISRDLARVSPY